MSKFLTTALLALGLALLCLPATAQEVEPNNTAATAQPLSLGTPITGRVSSLADEDYFSVELPAGAYRITFEYPDADPEPRDWWAVLDSDGNDIEHFFCYYPNGLHTMLFKVCEAGTFYVWVGANLEFNTLTNADYRFLLQPDDEDPAECNDTPATARTITEPTTLTGKINIPGDVDVVRIINAAPGLFLASINNSTGGGPAFSLTLYGDPNAAPIAQVNGQNTLETGLPAAGDYYLVIRYESADDSNLTPYQASIAFLSPSCDIDFDPTSIQSVAPVCGLDNGSIQVPQPTSGVAPFSYSLNGGAPLATGSFSGLAAGAYVVLITDADGCTATTEIILDCVECEAPEVGIAQMTAPGGVVSFTSVVVNGSVVSWNFGNGTTSTEANPTVMYSVNGSYSVTLTAQSACGAIATATTTVVILNGDFALGSAEGVAGQIIYIPLLSVSYDGPITSILAELRFDASVGRLVGFEDGRLQMNTGAFNPAINTFSYLFNSSGGETVVPGDTLFLIAIELVGEPGDSSIISVTGGSVVFEITGLIGAEARPILGSVIDGSFAIYGNIPINLSVRTPFGLPISNAEVAVETSDSTYIFHTNAGGVLETTVLYSEALNISVRKDTLIRAGISPADAFYFNRLIVQLSIPTLTPYTQLAGDVDCNGSFTTLDVVKILQWLVGLIDFPCQDGQIKFVPASHPMPPYPSPGYFDVPSNLVLENVDPAIGVNEVILGIVLADADGNAAPGFTQGEERTLNTAAWTYFTYQHADGTTRIRIHADQTALLGGLLDLRFGSGGRYLGYNWLGGSQAQVVLNETYAQRGLFKLAFIGTDGALSRQGEGMLELIFERDPGELSIHEDSQLYETSGNRLGIELSALKNTAGNTAGVAPNPAFGSFRVSWASNTASQQFQIMNTQGSRVFQAEVANGQILDAPLPAGIYLWKLADGQSGKLVLN